MPNWGFHDTRGYLSAATQRSARGRRANSQRASAAALAL